MFFGTVPRNYVGLMGLFGDLVVRFWLMIDRWIIGWLDSSIVCHF